MQTLIENAVKHNAFSADEPLVFTVTLNAASIEASNPVRARSLTTRGEGLGLANLANRVRLLTGLTVRVDRRLEQFRVTVPLVAGTVT
jgi:LytS/YehU family sensor histidine kinase